MDNNNETKKHSGIVSKNYLTVVYEYEEGATLPEELINAFTSVSREYKDTRIAGISFIDEINDVAQKGNTGCDENSYVPGWGNSRTGRTYRKGR